MAVRRQQPAEIDAEYGTEDPWGYFRNPHDEARKQILVSTLEEYAPTRVLDIGCGNGFITQSIPARSIASVTFKFCRQTSWMTWSKARCRNVE